MIALITDTHYGTHNDSPIFYNYQEQIFQEKIRPELKRRGVKSLIHLGDTLDRRKYVNFTTLKFVKDKIYRPLQEDGISIKKIIGNHDCSYKNTNSINSPSILFKEFDNIQIISEPTEDGKYLYLPWINSENYEKSMNLIRSTSASIVFGHLEIIGFKMMPGTICEEGLSSNDFEHFQNVYSGHFHLKSRIGNIQYLGCPWELKITDVDDPKGIYFLDEETDELEFFPTEQKMFNKLIYDDRYCDEKEFFQMFDEDLLASIRNTVVQVYVNHKTQPILFDRFCQYLNRSEAHSVSYSFSDYKRGEDEPDDGIEFSTDTLEIIRRSINDYDDLIPTEEKKKDLEKLIMNLYVKALNNND